MVQSASTVSPHSSVTFAAPAVSDLKRKGVLSPSSSSTTASSLSFSSAAENRAPLRSRGFSDSVRNDIPNRRLSIQFASSPAKGRGASNSPRPFSARRRRLPSPPPPPVFQPRVSFDTFTDKRDSSAAADIFSYALTRKHKDYEYTKRSRTFLCGLDANEHSDHALEWLVDELVDDGDEIVCLRVVERDSKIAGEASMEDGRYKDEAEALMSRIQAKNTENKAINLVLEFSVGKVQKTIDDMIQLYEPAILIVGTKGRSLGGIQGLLPGSVSKYCLQHSPVPVIVVRPNSKREKRKRKRQEDSNRYAYRELLERSNFPGGDVVGHGMKGDSREVSVEGAKAESAAVANAIGYDANTGISRLSISPSTHHGKNPTTINGRSGESSPEDLRSPGVVMKSPRLRDEESPDESDQSSDDEDASDGETEAVDGQSLPAKDQQMREEG